MNPFWRYNIFQMGGSTRKAIPIPSRSIVVDCGWRTFVRRGGRNFGDGNLPPNHKALIRLVLRDHGEWSLDALFSVGRLSGYPLNFLFSSGWEECCLPSLGSSRVCVAGSCIGPLKASWDHLFRWDPKQFYLDPTKTSAISAISNFFSLDWINFGSIYLDF